MTSSIKPLGTVLQQADLVSAVQVKLALQEQTQLGQMRLGEILARRGWIEQETADFFAEQLPYLSTQTKKQPLGQYLKGAALIDDRQIETILAEQKQTGLKFGEIIVKKGWLKRTTVDFFLNYINPKRETDNWDESRSTEPLKTIEHRLLDNEHCEPSRLLKLYRQILQQGAIAAKKTPEQAELLSLGLVVKQREKLRVSNPLYEKAFNLNWVEEQLANLQPFSQIRIKLFNLEEKASSPYRLLDEVLWWTGEQFYLTQKLCQLIAESESFITDGQEADCVAQIVQKYFIDNWETQPEAEPLRAMQQHLLENQHCDPFRLLRQYRQILRQGSVPANDSAEQLELLNLGLAVQQEESLRISNPIYERIFTIDWVETHLIRLHPWSDRLQLVQLEQKASSFYSVLEEIFAWTGEQFYLTQKLCQIVEASETFIADGQEAVTVDRIARNYLIDNWQTQAAAEPLRIMRQCLLENQQCEPFRLLKLYRNILRQVFVAATENPEQAELLALGLVVQQGDNLQVSNRIYEKVFNLAWVEKELIRLHPWRDRLPLAKLEQKATHPYSVLERIVWWTGEEFDLTQRLYRLIAASKSAIMPGEEAVRVDRIVKNQIIDRWEAQAAAEPLRVMQQNLLDNPNCMPFRLLKLYRQMLRQGDVPIDDTPEAAELLSLGLAVKQGNNLTVANRIYEAVFNLDWVTQELENRLRYSAAENPKNAAYQPIAPVTPVKRKRKQPPSPAGAFVKLFLLGLGVALAYLSGWAIYNYFAARTLFGQGNNLLSQGENEEAIATYDKLLKIDSNYYQAWTNRGNALARMKNYEAMLESCSTATIIEPKALYAWNCQGEALHNLKRYDEASEAFDKAISLDANDPIFWINKTEALLADKQINAAIESIDRAISLLEQSKSANARELAIAFNSQGKAYLQQESYEEALRAYDRALTHDSSYFAAGQGRGIALRKLKRYDEAIEQFQAMLDRPKQTDEQRAEIWYYLGLTFRNLDRTSDAIAAFDEALEFNPDYRAAREAKEKIGGRLQ